MQCSYNRRDISAKAAIVYTVFVYGHIQGVGVTASYCEAGEVGPNVMNNRTNQ